MNNSERRKAAKHGMGYNNPYDYGWRTNLQHFFGLYNGRTILRVLFPSTHTPESDGMSWPSNHKPVHYADPNAYRRFMEPRPWQKVFGYFIKLKFFGGAARKE